MDKLLWSYIASIKAGDSFNILEGLPAEFDCYYKFVIAAHTRNVYASITSLRGMVTGSRATGFGSAVGLYGEGVFNVPSNQLIEIVFSAAGQIDVISANGDFSVYITKWRYPDAV